MEIQAETSEKEEVLQIISKLKPDLKLTRLDRSGAGWVCLSVFAFSPTGRYYWIVIADGAIAFKRITVEWIKVYSNLILSSPDIYVEWDIAHKITAWAALQTKG